MTHSSFDAEFIIVIGALLTHSSAYNWIVLVLINYYRAV